MAHTQTWVHLPRLKKRMARHAPPNKHSVLPSSQTTGFPGGSDGRLSAMQKAWGQSLGRRDALAIGIAALSSILAWRIHGLGAWWATVHGVTKRHG